jgi:hypothetical protein
MYNVSFQGAFGLPDQYASGLSAVAENKAAIVSTVAHEYGRKAAFSEIQSRILQSKADKFKYYGEQYSRRAELFQKMAKEYRQLSEENESAAQVHENKSSDYASKSRMSREKAMELEAIKAEYMSRARQENRNFETATSRSQIALSRARGLENEAKNYFTWAANLIKISDVLRKEANIQNRHGLESKKRADSEEKNSKTYEIEANKHLNNAQFYETKASDISSKINEAFRLYEDFLVSATNEHNIGRENRVRATDEALIAKVYDQAAMDMKIIAHVQEGEYAELKGKAKATGTTAQVYKAAQAEVLHAAQVTRDTLRYKETHSS